MRLLKPEGRIDLDHRAYFLRATPDRSLIIAAYRNQLSIIGPEMKVAHEIHYPNKLRAVSPHPSGGQFALIDAKNGSLVVLSLAGQKVFDLAAPRLEPGAPVWADGYSDCYFDATGKFLWLVAALSEEETEIQLMDWAAKAVVQRTTISQPFGDCYYVFSETAQPDLISLCLAAGQDGQQLYWLRRDRAEFSCMREPILDDRTPPVFSPGGHHFVVIDDADRIHRFEFATMAETGPAARGANEEGGYGFMTFAYVDEHRVLACRGNGRLFIADADKMSVIEEVAVEGHELRPVGEYYLGLSDDHLASDISVSKKVGDIILFDYERDRSTASREGKDTLLWLRIGDIQW